jgi:hypothetical protein
MAPLKLIPRLAQSERRNWLKQRKPSTTQLVRHLSKAARLVFIHAARAVPVTMRPSSPKQRHFGVNAHIGVDSRRKVNHTVPA